MQTSERQSVRRSGMTQTALSRAPSGLNPRATFLGSGQRPSRIWSAIWATPSRWRANFSLGATPPDPDRPRAPWARAALPSFAAGPEGRPAIAVGSAFGALRSIGRFEPENRRNKIPNVLSDATRPCIRPEPHLLSHLRSSSLNF